MSTPTYDIWKTTEPDQDEPDDLDFEPTPEDDATQTKEPR